MQENVRKKLIIAGCLLLVCLSAIMAMAQESKEGALTGGRVYVMTNKADGNTIILLERSADGALTLKDEISTGGLGSGPGVLPSFLPPGPAPNPLQSQDSLIVTKDRRFLLAVNAGSNDISVLAVTPSGLKITDKAASGGIFPAMLAEHRGVVYVVNEGEQPNPNTEPNGLSTMKGFLLDRRGKLYAIPDSIRTIGVPGSDPADIVFSPDGNLLIVTEKFTNIIDIFPVLGDGHIADPMVLNANDVTPFGIAFTGHDILAVTYANSFLVDGRRNSVSGGSSTAIYRITDDMGLEPMGEPVSNHQTATCWIRFTPNGRFAYTANKGSGSISLYNVSSRGELTLAAITAADTGGAFSGPLDMAVTPNGKFLYLIVSFTRKLLGYHIAVDGSLTPVFTLDGLPLTVQGILAF